MGEGDVGRRETASASQNRDAAGRRGGNGTLLEPANRPNRYETYRLGSRNGGVRTRPGVRELQKVSVPITFSAPATFLASPAGRIWLDDEVCRGPRLGVRQREHRPDRSLDGAPRKELAVPLHGATSGQAK